MTDRATESREFVAIVRKHAPWILAWLSRRAPPGIDPDDLAQEVFLILHRKWEAILHPERIHAWLYGVARKVLAREIERMKRRSEVAEEVAARQLARAAPADLDPLDRAVRALPDDLALAVTTYYSSKVTYEEAAEILGIPRPTLQSRLRRALEILRRELRRESDARDSGR